jgi:hypothetical protein
MSKQPEFIPTPPFENTLSTADSMVTRTFELMPEPQRLSDEQLKATRVKLTRMAMLLVEGDLMLRQEQERRAES